MLTIIDIIYQLNRVVSRKHKAYKHSEKTSICNTERCGEKVVINCMRAAEGIRIYSLGDSGLGSKGAPCLLDK